MPHPASRVLAMLELLQARQRVTGAELAARLGVDERTVRRYAATLAELGIPVESTRGRYGGYRLGAGARVPPLVLTDNEAIAIVLGLATADRLGMTTEAPAMSVALAKIFRLLPERLGDRLATVQEAVGFPLQPRQGGVEAASAALLTLGTATRQRRRVSLSYRSWRGGETLHELDPYGLSFHQGSWYVAGRDHGDGDVRTFRLDRIGAVDLGEEEFTTPDGFDPAGHIARSLAPAPYTWEVEVLLEADLVQARQRVPEDLADLIVTGDGVLLRARVTQLETVARLLAGLGWPFTIVRPAELRAAISDYATQLIEHAQGSFARPR